MTWFKVDDTLAFHPKVLEAGNAAIGLWVRAGSWSAQQLTDGFVPDSIVLTLGGKASATALERVGLWSRVEGGWRFHQWDERQPTRSHVEAERQREREKKRRQRAAGAKAVDIDPNTGHFVSPGDNGRDYPGDPGGESPATRPVPSRPDDDSLRSSSSARARDRVPIDDDDPRIEVAKARSQRLYRGAKPRTWMRTTAASLDAERVAELRADGMSPADIDLALDNPSPANGRRDNNLEAEDKFFAKLKGGATALNSSGAA